VAVTAWLGGCKTAPQEESQQAQAATDVPPMPIISAAEAGSFVGSKACAECHPKEARQHATSMHARTLAVVEGHPSIRHFDTKQVVEDPALRMTYTTRVEDGKPVSRVQRSDGASEELTPRFVVGSGNHGYTFLFERNDQYLESRLSYYPHAKRWTWTPGQQELTPMRAPMGRRLDSGTVFSCFICHSTTLVHDGETARPEQSIFNVGCERCHGAGAAHVAAARERKSAGKNIGSIYRYRNAQTDTISRLCGECHRSPNAIPDDQLESTVDLPRFAGTAFGASNCFRKSGGQFSCISCHNPHARASTDRKSYERVCLSCHTGATEKQKPCPVNAKEKCISCHMPPQSLGDPDEVKFHNHWIRVWEKAKLAGASAHN
jgi:hypothetical protein